jgi:hypothetical protein
VVSIILISIPTGQTIGTREAAPGHHSAKSVSHGVFRGRCKGHGARAKVNLLILFLMESSGDVVKAMERGQSLGKWQSNLLDGVTLLWECCKGHGARAKVNFNGLRVL